MILDHTQFELSLIESLARMEALIGQVGAGDPPLDSILNQLRALYAATSEGRVPEAELKARFTFGLLASRSLVAIDRDLAETVMDLSSYVALRLPPPRVVV